MRLQKIYNLEEFAAKHRITDVFGAYAAHFTVDGTDMDDFRCMVGERTLFTKLLLTDAGSASLRLGQSEVALAKGSLLVVTARDVAAVGNSSPDFHAEVVLVDDHLVDTSKHYTLTDDRYASVQDIFRFVHNIVIHRHINKTEIMQSMFHVLRLFCEELPYDECSVTRDLAHKKRVYEIFLHLLYQNFKKKRQIRFYADKMNLSTAYLSRLVKEISGTTVNDHVSSLVYKEICNLLSQTTMTMGEISDTLNFSDQSAMTNFFKQRAGISPLAYRNKSEGHTTSTDQP